MGLVKLILERVLTDSSSLSVVPRAVNAARDTHEFTISTLTILSLTFASLSIISTLCTLYWFVKMRKSFRHELIMLLIQSDFIKSVAFLVFPIVSFLRGFVESGSKFCQASGFILAVGIEASDISVLLIALHSLMYIFRPRSGLYPYRRLAYLVYYVFPTLIASMAFIGGGGYENVGHYCYLKRDAGWRRMALSWIPRYIISTTIIVMYAFIYFYIRGRMIDYGRRSSSFVPEEGTFRPSMPAAPSLSYHGLLSSAATSRRGSAADSIATKPRQRSISSASSAGLTHDGFGAYSQAVASHSGRAVEWAWSGFPQQGSAEKPARPDDSTDPLAPVPECFPKPLPTHATCDIHHAAVEAPDGAIVRKPARTTPPLRTPRHSDEPVTQPAPVPSAITASLHHKLRPPHPQHKSLSSASRSKPPRSLARTADADTVRAAAFLEPGLEQNRDKIRRQLRSLFVYPLVYIIIWVFPFVSHVMGYDDSVRPGDPEWLLILGIISLCVQGTVDCALFTFRERPWRQARGGFWESLWKRLRLYDSDVSNRGLSGRTQEEMLVDGKLARKRRDEEEVWERMRRESSVQGSRKGVDKRGPREWWDVGFDDTSGDEWWGLEDDEGMVARRERVPLPEELAFGEGTSRRSV